MKILVMTKNDVKGVIAEEVENGIEDIKADRDFKGLDRIKVRTKDGNVINYYGSKLSEFVVKEIPDDSIPDKIKENKHNYKYDLKNDKLIINDAE